MTQFIGRAGFIRNGLATAIAVISSVGVHTSVAADEGENFGLEEVVVTAEHRAVNSQDVPIAMTAFSGDDVAQNFEVSSDISAQVPNVQTEAVYGFGTARVGIRGIAQNDFNNNATTPVMTYLDGVPMNSVLSQGVPLWDVERVEVLRGPQGTLYGRNATAGALQYISVEPSEEFEAAAEVTVGRYGQRKFNGAIGGTLAEGVRARVSFVDNTRDGDHDNIILGKDQGEVDYEAYRGILDWDVTNDLSLRFKAQYFEGDQDVVTWKTTPGLVAGDGFGPAPDPLVNGWTSVAEIQASYGFQGIGPSDDFDTAENGFDPNEHIEHELYSVEANWDLGAVILTSITGYMEIEQAFMMDGDSSPAPILNEFDLSESRQVSQEVRLASATDDPLQWIAGVFWLNETMGVDINFDATSWRGNVSYGFPDAETVMYTRGQKQELDTYAAFFHGTYDFSEKLTATAAVRYTVEDKDIDYRFRSQWDFPTDSPRSINQGADFINAVKSGNLGNQLAAAAPSESLSESWSEVTWRFALDYMLNEDALLFTSVSKGFKGGAFKPTANGPGEIVAVDPETVISYELGIKSDWWDGRARVNGTVFLYDYENYQTNQLDPGTATQILSNMPEARLQGAELELQLMPVENLSISFGMGYVDAEITKSDPASLEGNNLPYAEDFNYNGLIRYDIETGLGIITPQISFNKRGNFFTTKENVVELGDYTLVNARLGYESSDGNFYGGLWVKNLTDEVEPVTIDDATEFFGSDLGYVNAGRTYGLTLGMKF